MNKSNIIESQGGFNPIFAKHLKFSEADFDANRNGYITENQIPILHRRVGFMWLGVLILTGVFIFIIIAMIKIPYEKGYLADFHFYFAGIYFLTFPVGLFLMASDIRGVRRDIVEQRIERTSGVIKLRTYKGNCKAIINKLTFNIPDDIYKVLQSGGYYTFYYSAWSKILLSME